jgi:hypothetical protein
MRKINHLKTVYVYMCSKVVGTMWGVSWLRAEGGYVHRVREFTRVPIF